MLPYAHLIPRHARRTEGWDLIQPEGWDGKKPARDTWDD